MTPVEYLKRAKQMLLSEQYAPIIGNLLDNAKDVPTAAALLVYPIVFKMQQDSGMDDDEILGTEDGDGIAIHLLALVFEVAADAGYIPGGSPDDTEDAADAEQDQGEEQEPGGAPPEANEAGEPAAEDAQEEMDPAMRQMAEQAVAVLADLLQKGDGAMTQAIGGGEQAPPQGAPPAPQPKGLMGGPP